MNLSNSQLQVVHDYLVDDAPLLYFVLNNDGLIGAVNAFTNQTLGRDVVGSAFDELLVDFKKTFNLKGCIDTDTHHLLSISILDADPKSFFFTFKKFDDSILVLGKEDVEELDLLRSELFRSNQELNNLTRTLHKKNAQLDYLNTIKNQFLGMAAHDLRKPISVILSYSEFLLDEAQEQLDEEQISFLYRIEKSAHSMKRLVDDFLDVSTIEAGGFQLNVTPVNPADVLERSLVLARIQAQKKGIDLKVQIDPELCNIPLDDDKIEQAMSNLLGNAIEHSFPGESVAISLKKSDGQVRFSVCDKGTGMSPEVMEQLFTPFSSAGVGKTSGEQSTGLGLTITRKITDAHGGEIITESEEGAGTTFTILFKKMDNG